MGYITWQAMLSFVKYLLRKKATSEIAYRVDKI